jgi:polar amino acid transport system substrate-binding protein
MKGLSMKKRYSSIAIATAMFLALGLTLAGTAQAAPTPKVGVACSKLGVIAKVGLITYSCALVQGKREWTEPWFTKLKKSASLYRTLPADIKEKGKLVFATDPTDPPFQFFSADNDLIGAEIDLANAVGKILGVKVEFVSSGFSAIIPGVEAGRFDASVSAFASTTARQKIVDFVTYFNSSRAFLFRKGTLPTVKTEADLCGIKVGVPAGTTMATAIVGLSTNCTTAGKAAIAYSIYPDQATTVLAVRSGRADLTILSAHVSSWWQQNAGDELEIVLRADQGADYNGMVVRKGGLSIVMQKAVQQLMNDGTFKTIFAKWNIEKLMRAKAEINISTR